MDSKINSVELTDHAEEKPVPDWEIKKIIEKQKGQLFHDRKHDSWARVKGRTVVIYEPRGKKAVVITAYRYHDHKFSSNRFKQVRSTEVG